MQAEESLLILPQTPPSAPLVSVRFVEIVDDVVLTVEYSVRAARNGGLRVARYRLRDPAKSLHAQFEALIEVFE